MCLDADSPVTTAVLPCTPEFYLAHSAQVHPHIHLTHCKLLTGPSIISANIQSHASSQTLPMPLSPQAYTMSSSPRGFALVVSNVRFQPELSELDTRRGGEVDEEVLRRLFTELDFTVSLHKDLTLQVPLSVKNSEI